MAVEETEFTQVFRGYDKDEVDKSINGHRRDVIKANNQLAEQAKEHKRLLARIDELNAELEEVGSPTFSSLGTKLEHTEYTGLEVEPSIRIQRHLEQNATIWGALSRAVRRVTVLPPQVWPA